MSSRTLNYICPAVLMSHEADILTDCKHISMLLQSADDTVMPYHELECTAKVSAVVSALILPPSSKH